MESSKAVLRLFEEIVARGEAGVSDLARWTGEPKTTTQRGLTTLHDAGWLRVVPTAGGRRWSPSTHVMMLAGKLDMLRPLREAAIPVMNRLRDESCETVHLTVREGGEVVLVDRVDSPQTLRTIRPLGSRAPLHVTSNGKSILAALSAVELDRYFSTSLVSLTDRTITDADRLRADLRLVGARGYAVGDGELELDIKAVGAAIMSGGLPVAGLSICGPSSRLNDRQVAINGRSVAEAAAEISRSL